METCAAILKRRSIRMFKDEEVNKDILLEGIKMGIKAPSAHNRQPWKFKILSKEEKDKVALLLLNKTKDIPGHTGPHTAAIMQNVPNLIMIFYDNDNLGDRDMDIISIGACIENMILYFTDLGLGTLWIGNTNLINEEIKELLNIDLDTISCLGVGYKDQELHERPRKDMKDVLI